jgi:multisite-specific tRNA:(cytosine-C5)-methyltransferase
MLYGEEKTLSPGCVIANDVDYSRAQMLIHQVNRSGTAGMVVINHNGQYLPQIKNELKQKILFDKILADVPCSGDGATRKLPNKWSDWHSNDGACLHPLQLNILMRGISMLKEDGYLLYSTCSLNPIEDEAVILELMRRVQSGLEIVDIHNRGVPGRRGLTSWEVLESKGK